MRSAKKISSDNISGGWGERCSIFTVHWASWMSIWDMEILLIFFCVNKKISRMMNFWWQRVSRPLQSKFEQPGMSSNFYFVPFERKKNSNMTKSSSESFFIFNVSSLQWKFSQDLLFEQSNHNKNLLSFIGFFLPYSLQMYTRYMRSRSSCNFLKSSLL
jgi:hypothetical protein